MPTAGLQPGKEGVGGNAGCKLPCGWVFVYHWDSASPTLGFQRLSLVRPTLLEKKDRE